MHTFKDKEGKEWTVELTLDKVMEIERYDVALCFNHQPDEEGNTPPFYIQFLDPDEEFFQTHLTNTRLVFTILWILCKEQGSPADVHNMEDFAKRFDGESLNKARMAFYEELPDFFPSRKMTLKASIQRYFDAMLEMDKQTSENLKKRMTPQVIRRTVAREVAKMNVEFDEFLEAGKESD